MSDEKKIIQLSVYQSADREHPPGGPTDGGAGGDDIEPVFASDDYLADRLTVSLGDDWRCAAGDWYRWDGWRWKREETRLVWDRSRRICRCVAKGIDNPSLSRK